MIQCIENIKEKEQIAKEILEQLPEWFGLPENTAQYIETCKTSAVWAYKENDQVKGFLAAKETSQFAIEIHVMGVRKEAHHQGIGTKLFEAFYAYAREKEYEFMQVKTVQKGHYKEYDQTNAFYESLGFRELECLPTLWDVWNPCQIYIKSIM